MVTLYTLPSDDVNPYPQVKSCVSNKASASKFVRPEPLPVNIPSVKVIPLPVTDIEPVNL